jgi:hypothetical protein
LEIGGYSVIAWLFLFGLMLPVAMVVVAGFGFVEWSLRSLFPADAEKSKYSKDNLWIAERRILAFIAAYALIVVVGYSIYAERLCGPSGGGEFCF